MRPAIGCDHCEARTTPQEREGWGIARVGEHLGGGIDIDRVFDLCPTCLRILRKWLGVKEDTMSDPIGGTSEEGEGNVAV